MMKDLIMLEGKNMIFEGKNVEIAWVDDEVLFELYSVGAALGYTTTAKGKEYPHKIRINKTVQNADIEPVVHGGKPYLNEEMIYDFMFEAKTDKCKTFRKWLSREVLPSIRQNGAYVAEGITDKQQELLLKYSTTALRRKTFLETTIEKLEETYLECMEYNSKKNGQERVKIEKEIIKALEEKKEIVGKQGQVFSLAVAEQIDKIQKRAMERSNRSYAARLAHKNKKLNEAYDYILQLEPQEEDYLWLNLHGFSINSMYEPNVTEFGIIRTNFKGQPKLRKTERYKEWLKNFKTEMDKIEDLNIDFSKDLDIYLYFDHMKQFDCSNFHKSFFDALANYFKVDDKRFHLRMCDTNEYVDSYNEGKIYFCIKEK